MRNRILALLASLALAVGIFAVDLSNPGKSVEASCSQAYVDLFKDADFGNGLRICYAPLGSAPGGIADLASYPGWDNVTSSIRFTEAPTTSVNTSVCVYTFAGYQGLIKKFTANGETVNWKWWNGENDQVSSVLFGC